MTVNRIVVGVDGSEGASHGLQFCAELAAQAGADVVAVHAFEPLALVGKVEPPLDFHRLRDQTEQLLGAEWCKPLVDAGVSYRTVVVEEDPVTALVDVAAREGADLIVVGTRGVGGFRGLVVGSVATKLPQRATIPVTIVPPVGRGV